MAEEVSAILRPNLCNRSAFRRKIHPAYKETFQAIVKAKESISANALRDQLGINLTAANERLAKLSTIGLVRREKATSIAGREQFLYTVLK